MTSIHSTAIIESGAEMAESVTIGPYCYVGENVKLDKGVTLKMNAIVDGYTEIGENTAIYPFATVGLAPQDRKYRGEPSRLIIGKNNRIREYVSIHPGTEHGGMETRIGDNNLFLVCAHVGHDCLVGNYVTMSNSTALGGHVVIEDYVTVGGLSAVQQFSRIGAYAMIGGAARINKDILPYALVIGSPGKVIGINQIGLKRNNFSSEAISQLRKMYQILFYSKSLFTLKDKLRHIRQEYPDNQYAEELISFHVESQYYSIKKSDLDD